MERDSSRHRALRGVGSAELTDLRCCGCKEAHGLQQFAMFFQACNMPPESAFVRIPRGNALGKNSGNKFGWSK